MSVKYRKVINNRKNSPTKGKVYGRAVSGEELYIKEIASNISGRCTLTEPDIIAVINALETEVAKGLAQGRRVVLEGFGAFKIGLTTTPADTAKQFTASNVKSMHVIFQPAIEMDQGKRIKSMLKGVKVEEMPTYNGLEASSGSAKPSGGGNTPSGSDSGGSGSSGSTSSGGSTGEGGSTPSGGSDGDNTVE